MLTDLAQDAPHFNDDQEQLDVAAALEAAAGGDFGRLPSGDGRAARAARAVIERLRLSALEQLDGAVAISTNLNDTAMSCARLRHRAGEAASSAQRVATVSQQISAAIAAIEGAAGEAHRAATVLSGAAMKGRDAAGDAAERIGCISRQVGAGYDAVVALNEVSDEISGIAGAIFDIATKTNLLAVNASIEAARAGAAGRGFAIVAEEVRALSEQTGAATKQVRGGVDNLRRRVEQVCAMMLEARDAAAGGAEAVQEMNRAMSATSAESADNSLNINDAMDAIEATLAEQSAATRELAESAGVLSDGAQITLEAVDRAGASVDDALAAIQAGLDRAAALQVPGKVLRLAKADHALWKKKLADLVLGKRSLSPSELRSHRECRLGRWYFGAEGRAFAGAAAYQALNQPHQAVHDAGIAAAEAMRRGDGAEAVRLLGEVERASAEVIRLLDAMLAEEAAGAAQAAS